MQTQNRQSQQNRQIEQGSLIRADSKTNANEAIAQAVVESTRVKIQAMDASRAEKTQTVEPKLGRSVMKQLTLNWNSIDKYAELRNFKLEIKICFKTI